MLRRFSLALAALPLVACGGSDSGAESPPEPPTLEMVMPMEGALHVEWSTHSSCDEVEAERKDPSHAFAVAFSADGAKASYMDGAASQDMMYTYRLRCELGGEYSDYSNEMSANPTDESM